MLELAGLSRQEILVVKACATSKTFEGYAQVLIDHYSGVHLREGSRSWQGRGTHPKNDGGKGGGFSTPSHKGKGFTRRAYAAYPEEDEAYEEHPEMGEQEAEEETYVGLLGAGDDDEVEEAPDAEYQYIEDVDEYEAIALNAAADLDETADARQIGEAIQLQLAAFVAFGKAKGKGGKGKGKGKGKIVRSHLSLEDRRKQLLSLKAKSKCLRCGGMGHWSGDPQCKFPSGKKPAAPPTTSAPKPVAHFVDMSDSSSDDGLYLPAAGDSPCAHMAAKIPKGTPSSRPAPSSNPRLGRSEPLQGYSSPGQEVTFCSGDMLRPFGSDTVFLTGIYKGKSFWEVLHKFPHHYHWSKGQERRSQILADFVAWVDQYFIFDGESIVLRDEPKFTEPSVSASSSKTKAKKKPPVPPKPQKCQHCQELTRQGSTAYTIRQTCLDCGHATTIRRDQEPQFDPAHCPHTEVDFRGSSRSTHRTFCKQCQTFIDETPHLEHKHRVAIGKAVETASPSALPVIESLVQHPNENNFCLGPEELEHSLSLFTSKVVEASETEDMTPVFLHQILDECIKSRTEDSWEETEPHAFVCCCLKYGAGDTGMYTSYHQTDMTDGIVHVDTENMRQMYGGDHIYVVLDEGCNSTCHSQFWAKDAEAKLKAWGYAFPFVNQESKSFAGLGAKGNQTEGLRRIPFALMLGNGEPVNGVIESHQLTQGETPLLLSLHAQAHLGLVKDMRRGTCSIGGQEVPIYRCSKTGLLMLCISEGFISPEDKPDRRIPKCHRSFRTAFMAQKQEEEEASRPMEWAPSGPAGFRLRANESGHRAAVAALNSDAEVVILTGGYRYGTRLPKTQRATWTIDLRLLHDPSQNRTLRGHIGCHPLHMKAMCKLQQFKDIVAQAKQWLSDEERPKAILIICTSGRHRSVCMGLVLHLLVEALDMTAETVHMASGYWCEMECNAQCAGCRLEDAESFTTAGEVLPPMPPPAETVSIQESTEEADTDPEAPLPSDTASPSAAPINLREAPEVPEAPGSDPIDRLTEVVSSLADLVVKGFQKFQRTSTESFSVEDRPRTRSRSRPREEPIRASSAYGSTRAASPRSRRGRPVEVQDRAEIENMLREIMDRNDVRSRWPDHAHARVSVRRSTFGVRARPLNLSERVLERIVDYAVENGNRDRMMWVTEESSSAGQKAGVRIDIKIRGAVRTNEIKFPQWMSSWKKTSFTRAREGTEWQCMGSDEPIQDTIELEEFWSHLIVVSQPPMSEDGKGRGKYLPSHGEVRDISKNVKRPPTPPKARKRNNDTSQDQSTTSQAPVKAPILERKEHHLCIAPSSPSSDSLDQTAFMAIRSHANDLDPSPTEQETLADVSVDPVERTTMSKRHRRQIHEGIVQLNHHDQAVAFAFGLKGPPKSESKIAVFTSHPLIFQDEFDVYDIGPNAENLDEVFELTDTTWQNLFAPYDFIIVAVHYRDAHDPLGHGQLLYELEMHADMSNTKFLHVDVCQTPRWENYSTPQVPYIVGDNIGFTCNHELLQQGFASWANDKNVDQVLSWDFVEWVKNWSQECMIDDLLATAFPAAVAEEHAEERPPLDETMGEEDVAAGNPVEEIVHEETLLDELEIPGFPKDEAARRVQWRKLPQRVRIGIRRLHRQFGHVPRQVLINLLRAAKVNKEFIDGVRLHRCTTCEDTAKKPPTHKVSMPYEYRFNHALGIDLLEVVDSVGQKYQVLNMVCLGTTFQQACVVRVGAGQCSSSQCLAALQRCWFAWAGHPTELHCDRGLHNRGVLAQYMKENNIQVYHAALESPEGIGRVERHGGILKGMFRKVCKETGAHGREQVETILSQVVQVKNDQSRMSGFSPSQWVLGRAPRADASLMDEEQWAEFGAIQASIDPTSIFALQHMARREAKLAFVHLDCSKRVQRALLRNASAFARDYQTGDLVCFRRDNQRGGTAWSPTCRVIGQEGEKNLWLLCGNVPVLVAKQNVRPVNASEALAQSVLEGKPIVPLSITGTGQQSFWDRREQTSETIEVEDQTPPQPGEGSETFDYSPSILEEGEWHISPEVLQRPQELEGIEEEDSEDQDAVEEIVSSRRRASTEPENVRNVRQRTQRIEPRQANRQSAYPSPGTPTSSSNVTVEPEQERGASLQSSRRGSQSSTGPAPWPNILLDDLPVPLRRHFERAREDSQDPDTAMHVEEWAKAFLAQGNDEETGKRVLKTINYETAPEEVKQGINGSRGKEWSKYEHFSAAIPIVGQQKQDLLDAGHVPIPSKWVDSDKHEFKKGLPGYEPFYKSRLVSCGNYETAAEGIRSDSPTADGELHHVVAAWASCHQAQLHSADVANAYFQARPLDRILLMRQPRGGLPNVDPEALLLIRVPVYGLTDSGRGFWLKLNDEAIEAGMQPSLIYPAFYFKLHENKCVAVLTTHVDDLLYAFLPEGKEATEKLLSKFELGASEQSTFRYCGKQFTQTEDGTITIDVADNTRRIPKIKIQEGRRLNEKLKDEDITRLRSAIGSLSWITRQGRPDLAYRVSRLQTSDKHATVGTLHEANKVIDLAHKDMTSAKYRFPARHLNWEDIGVITVTDASFSNEPGFRSQQGRVHFIGSAEQIKDPECWRFRVITVSCSSTTMKRVSKSTLQAETYALQNGTESADKIRAVLAEMKGCVTSRRTWEKNTRENIPHLIMTDCRSLHDHLMQEVQAKVSDKRLGIELASLHEMLWDGDQPSWKSMPLGGERLIWVATATMVADCLTKSMKPDFLLEVLLNGTLRVELLSHRKGKKN